MPTVCLVQLVHCVQVKACILQWADRHHALTQSQTLKTMAISSRQVAAEAVEGRDKVTLLRVDHTSRALSVLQQLAFPDLHLPTAVQVGTCTLLITHPSCKRPVVAAHVSSSLWVGLGLLWSFCTHC